MHFLVQEKYNQGVKGRRVRNKRPFLRIVLQVNLVLEIPLGLTNVMELFLKGVGIYQVVHMSVDITHKRNLKRCFEGQIKQHLEAYLVDKGMSTDIFQMEERSFINSSKCQKAVFLWKKRGVITHLYCF